MKDNYSVVRNNSVINFLDINEVELRKNITKSNFILGCAKQHVDGVTSYEDPIFLTIYNNSKVVGQALNTDVGHNLLVYELPVSAVPFLVDEFTKYRKTCLGVRGEDSLSKAVAKTLAEKWNKSFQLRDRNGVYELNSLKMPDTKGLTLIKSEEVDNRLMFDWTKRFIEECDLNPNLESKKVATDYLKRHEKIKGYRFLKNSKGEILSMAVKHREFEDRATISLVYTPPDFRRRGYGKIVTALISKELLDGTYSQLNLFTDLKNPTSNKIYKEVGYEFIGENVNYIFRE
jgi:uncharacterized protein